MVLRIVLAILLGVPGTAGLAVFGVIAAIWAYEGFRFLDSDRQWMPLFIIPSVACILFSVLTLGIVLRFARWKNAPSASLVLAILSIATIVLGYQLMLDSFTPDDTESPIWTLVASVAGLIVVSAPPFLHWWQAGRRVETPTN
jgi:hypothetical protein